MVPTAAAGKNFIDEISRLLNLSANDTLLKNIAFETNHVMSALLLQKPNKTSKAKDYLKALGTWLRLWEEGNESETIQERLPLTNSQSNIEIETFM